MKLINGNPRYINISIICHSCKKEDLKSTTAACLRQLESFNLTTRSRLVCSFFFSPTFFIVE